MPRYLFKRSSDLPGSADIDRQLNTLKSALDKELITATEFTTLGQRLLTQEAPKTCLLQSTSSLITLPEGISPSQGKFTIEYQLNPMTIRYMTFRIHAKGSENYEAQLLKKDPLSRTF
ncbi:hypothetical protein [Candidatus Cyanaurora vandensis]|uniref:hypothetical protein n=1 Tax=Candidatus Cyanaurora vandensis TaxID=2714958 RepID=UPI00257A433E|nr:hypothetical protein [Candidatus Cyanaurora vandensis]